MTDAQIADLFRRFFPRSKLTQTTMRFVRACAAVAADERVRALDGLLAGHLWRRVEVEQFMLDAANGKAPMPDAATLRAWALRLGSGPGGAEAHDAMRAGFEAFISGPPFEREVSRYPQDDERYAWPGCYTDIDVDLAWQAWCERGRQVQRGSGGE